MTGKHHNRIVPAFRNQVEFDSNFRAISVESSGRTWRAFICRLDRNRVLCILLIHSPVPSLQSHVPSPRV
jgi:hypothetical protein